MDRMGARGKGKPRTRWIGAIKAAAHAHSRSTPAVRGAIAASLASSLAVLPAFEIVHVLFAAHSHRYCPEHGQIEDIPRSRSADWDTAPDPKPAFREDVRPIESEFQSLSHIACAVLTGDSSRGRLVAAQSSPQLQFVPDPGVLVASQALVAPSCPLFVIAPKQSPPLAIAAS